MTTDEQKPASSWNNGTGTQGKATQDELPWVASLFLLCKTTRDCDCYPVAMLGLSQFARGLGQHVDSLPTTRKNGSQRAIPVPAPISLVPEGQSQTTLPLAALGPPAPHCSLQVSWENQHSESQEPTDQEA